MRHPSLLVVSGLLVLAGLSPVTSRAAVPSLQQPEVYAVVIGISQYREEVIPKVAYAVKDAEAVAKLLETQAGIPKSHIRLLTETKATGNDLRTVGEWLRMRVKPASTVYVYYAGHGTPDPKTGDAYLVPWDGHPDFPSGLYPLKALYESLNQLPAKHVIVMLDSCFSGAAGRSVLPKGARPMVLSLENPLLAAGKVVVLAAATGNQISSDYDKVKHGLFTHYLLIGLRGDADSNKDRVVTLQELYSFVRDQVAQTAVEALNREQTPILVPGEESLGPRIAVPLVQIVSRRKASIDKTRDDLSEALSRAERELRDLEAKERELDDQEKLALVQRQVEEKRKQIEEKKKRMEDYLAESAPAGDPVSDRQAYDRAMARFKQGDVARAQEGFAQVLVQYPGSPLAANAQFWLGECYYRQRKYDRAIEAYERILIGYPASEKVPAALLKLGHAYLALKERQQAWKVWKQLVEDYPRSPEAGKAMDGMKQVEQSPLSSR